MLVAVAEDVVSQGKAPGEGAASGAVSVESAFRVVSAMTAFAAALLATQPSVSFAQALPTGGQVTAGQASISQNSDTMTINQGSQRTVIDWNSFNIGSGNTVQFNQPNAQSQALNRVTSGGASNIQGSLLANGQVLIQNANGVLFGKGSVVNVGSLLATTKAINPDAFMAGGPLQLSSTGTNASVENDGSIQAQGYVTLVGDQVRNTGSINTAQGGQVVLAAGDSATVALPNGQGIQLTLSNATANALVENSGTINAQNGSVLLTARGTNTLLNTVVNLDGVTRAGTVVADAGNTGDVAVTGKVDASNNAAGGVGGTVVLSGNRVGVFGNATVDVSGDAAGGKVIMGGDSLHQLAGTQAQSMLQDGMTFADYTQVDAGASIKADSAHGNGGFVETSGHSLDVQGTVSAAAPNGKSGQWLIDPTNVTISTSADSNYSGTVTSGFSGGSNSSATVSNGTINNALNAGTDVTITTASSGTATGSITQAAGADNGSTNIDGNSTNGNGTWIEPNATINTTDNGTTNISGNSTNGAGVIDDGTINTSDNGTTNISGNSTNGQGVIDTNGTFNTDGNGTVNVIDNGDIIHTGGGNKDHNTTDNGGANGGNNGGSNGGDNNGTDNGTGGNTNAHSSSGSSAGGTAAAVVGGLGVAGGLSYLIYENAMHMYLDEAQPLTLELGDAAFTITSTDKKMWTGSLTGSAPIFDDGLRMTGGVSRQQYFINAGTPVKGVATTAQAGVQYPFARGLDANVWGGASLLHSQTSTDLTDYDATTHSKLDSLQLSLTADNGERARALRTNLAAGQIALTLGHQRNDDPSEPITRRAGNYAKLTSNAFGTYALSKSGNLFASGRISGQLASRNLDASEKLGLSGPDAVRAYRADEGSADEGVVASVGLYQRFPVATGHQLQVGLFNDFAYGRVNHSPWDHWENTYPGVSGVTNNRVLAGYGVSVDWLTPIGATVSASVSRPYRFSESSWVEPGKKPTQYWLSVTWSH
ncbi:filamentous hemagglutinin N-terminal domain-containing protein [Caballeronia sp. Sq4a]|nr:filamentous hemagglutinin N-terminal domain-containing protein [Caballeronia sp. Sq4a]